MKEQVLKQMIAVVDETLQHCKSDFYKWDLKELSKMNEDEPFLWSCREAATTLLSMNEHAERKLLNESETYRFSFMRFPNSRIDWFAQTSSWGGRSFYYDGAELKEIDIDKAGNYAKDIFTPIVEHLKAFVYMKYAAVDGDYFKRLSIRFEDKTTWLNVLHIARTDEGKDLLENLRHFRHYVRTAKNQYISIGRDFADKSFTFAEMVNDNCIMNGGVIYYHGKWNIHT
jgi:hypothetical protein